MPISGTAKAVRVPATTSSGGGGGATVVCVTDTFDRTVAIGNGWGTGNFGPWTVPTSYNPNHQSVNGASGVMHFQNGQTGPFYAGQEMVVDPAGAWTTAFTMTADVHYANTLTDNSSHAGCSFDFCVDPGGETSALSLAAASIRIHFVPNGFNNWYEAYDQTLGRTVYNDPGLVQPGAGTVIHIKWQVFLTGMNLKVWWGATEPGWQIQITGGGNALGASLPTFGVQFSTDDPFGGNTPNDLYVDFITICSIPATVVVSRPYRGVKVYGNLGTGIWTTLNPGSQVTLGSWLVGWDTDGYMYKNDLGAQNPVIPSGMGGYYEVTMNIQIAERTPVPTTGMVQLDLFAQTSADSTVLSRQMYYGKTEWINDLGYVTDMRLKWTGYLPDGAWVTGTLLNYFDVSPISLDGGLNTSVSFMELRYLGQNYGGGGDNIYPQYGLIAQPPVTFVDGFNRNNIPTTTWAAGGASPLGTSSTGVGWVAGFASDGFIAVGVTNTFYSRYFSGLAVFKAQTGISFSTARHGIDTTGSPITGAQQWTMVILFAWNGSVGTSTFVVATSLSGGFTQAAVEISGSGNFLIDGAGNTSFGTTALVNVWYYVKLQYDPVAATLQVRMWDIGSVEPATWAATRTSVPAVYGPSFYIEVTETISTEGLYVDSVWVFPGLI